MACLVHTAEQRHPCEGTLVNAALCKPICQPARSRVLLWCTMSFLGLQLVLSTRLAKQCWRYAHKLVNCTALSQKELSDQHVRPHPSLSLLFEHQAEAIPGCRSHSLWCLQPLSCIAVAYSQHLCLSHGVKVKTLSLSGSHWLPRSLRLPCARSSPESLPKLFTHA